MMKRHIDIICLFLFVHIPQNSTYIPILVIHMLITLWILFMKYYGTIKDVHVFYKQQLNGEGKKDGYDKNTNLHKLSLFSSPGHRTKRLYVSGGHSLFAFTIENSGRYEGGVYG